MSKSSGSPRGSFITSHPSCVTQPSLQNAAGTHQGSHCIPDPLSQCCTGTHEKSHPCSLKRWNSNIREGEQQPPQSWGCPWTLPCPEPQGWLQQDTASEQGCRLPYMAGLAGMCSLCHVCSSQQPFPSDQSIPRAIPSVQRPRHPMLSQP